jgi:hypothetical protein
MGAPPRDLAQQTSLLGGNFDGPILDLAGSASVQGHASKEAFWATDPANA